MNVKSMEEIQNNLTIYKGFTYEELQVRADRHRAAFEKQARDQGEYLPSEDELHRWFTVTPPNSITAWSSGVLRQVIAN